MCHFAPARMLKQIAALSPPRSVPKKSQFSQLCGAQSNLENWFFTGSENGAKTMAVLFNVVSSLADESGSHAGCEFLSILMRSRCMARQKNPPPQPSPTRAGGSLNRARGQQIVAFCATRAEASAPTKGQIKTDSSSVQLPPDRLAEPLPHRWSPPKAATVPSPEGEPARCGDRRAMLDVFLGLRPRARGRVLGGKRGHPPYRPTGPQLAGATGNHWNPPMMGGPVSAHSRIGCPREPPPALQGCHGAIEFMIRKPRGREASYSS